MYTSIIENVRQKNPLVQAITNYVTVNDCANMLLACGASPIMADNPEEAADIAALAAALVINIGTPNPVAITGMKAAGAAHNKRGKPVVFDPVGAGASTYRNTIIAELLDSVKFSVIRGNSSEIKYLAGAGGHTKGVDAADEDTVSDTSLSSAATLAKNLSAQTGAVIVITGATDIVANSERAYAVRNGHALMSKVTGTGCMLTALLGAFSGANPQSLLDACVCAVSAAGLCGERAHSKMEQLGGGTGTFRTLLIDYMSILDGKTFEQGAKIALL